MQAGTGSSQRQSAGHSISMDSLPPPSSMAAAPPLEGLAELAPEPQEACLCSASRCAATVWVKALGRATPDPKEAAPDGRCAAG
eukprot:CAMPEP_0175802854 /NCGR_PEP_ID=MMETSP0097-20121207/88249_1 /TAXON_ID=311494 /ORGANISM="Alexandrium monilatum, Strain CCMP3105" /LENGTH=83 /DNA_ID=CAMNT_0017114191 /DNA_START=38 /DNA_END=285 /DNA_ORIENTATION=+